MRLAGGFMHDLPHRDVQENPKRLLLTQ